MKDPLGVLCNKNNNENKTSKISKYKQATQFTGLAYTNVHFLDELLHTIWINDEKIQSTYLFNRFRNLEHFEETPFFLTYLPTDLNNIQCTQVQSIMVNSLNLLHSQNMPSIN